VRVRAARWAIGVVSLALAALAPLAARAEGTPRVVLVSASSTPFSARLRAEIEDMGFAVEPAPLLAGSAAPPTVAAVQIVDAPPPRRVRLWIAAPGSDHLVLRATVEPSPAGDDATEAVRAAEQLRAFFQPLREPPPPPHPSPAPPPSPDPPVAPAPVAPGPRAVPRPFTVSVAVAVPLQPGGPGADVALRGRWMATRLFGVGAFAALPVLGSTVKAAEGSASLSAFLFGGDVSVVAHPLPALRVSTHAGLGIAWLRTSGSASAPFRGQAAAATFALPVVGAEIAPRLAGPVRLCFDGQAGFSLPSAEIVFAGRPVATWGRPLGLLSAGASVDF
jgi:hypothetical protein